jgi:hypothetical protein
LGVAVAGWQWQWMGGSGGGWVAVARVAKMVVAKSGKNGSGKKWQKW